MNGSEIKKAPTKSVAQSAFFFGLGTLTTRILGLIRDVFLVSILTIDVKDAFFAALRVVNFFRRILGEGGLSASFVPVFVEHLAKDRKAELRTLIDGAFTLLFLVSSLICIFAVVTMDDVVSWWLNGKAFTDIPGKLAKTVTFSRIMMGFLLCMSLFAYFMAILNGVKQFTLTGFAPVLFNIAVVTSLLIFGNHDDPGYYAAIAVLVGGILQFSVLVPAVWRLKLLPRFSLVAMYSRQVKKVLHRFTPTLLGLGVVQVMGLVNTRFASQLESGAVAYFYIADRLFELPLSLIGVSIGTALLPTLAEHWHRGEAQLFSRAIRINLQLYLYLAIPAAFGLWFLANIIVEVLFVRGQFTLAEVPIVANVIKVYCLLLLCAGSVRILNQAFYAAQDTITPSVIAVSGLTIHILLAPYLMKDWGLLGLAASTAVVSLINVKVAGLLVCRRFGFAGAGEYAVSILKMTIAAGVMGLFLFLAAPYLAGMPTASYRAVGLVVTVGLAMVLYFSLTLAMGCSEASIVRRRFR